MTVNPLVRLVELGQSPWYDYITRDLLDSGELSRLIEQDALRGMTTNPTIFEKAVEGSGLYDDDIRRLVSKGAAPSAIYESIAVADVQRACDEFRPLYDETGGRDGFVSIEVSPALAYETEETISEAKRLWKSVDRPNVMIKIPGTREGLPAVEDCIASGLNINITLLFAVTRYEEVIEVFWSGLEQRLERGDPIDHIASVASFFVSRIDTKVDALLDELDDHRGLRGKIAIANAWDAYSKFDASLKTDRWKRLAEKGAGPQRVLWASTSTKDPKYPDIYYIDSLVAPQTVNTMPPQTFDAYRDHGEPELQATDGMAAAPGQLETLAELGIDLDRVTRELEVEGVDKFAASFDSLLAGIEQKAGALAGSAGD